MDQSTDPFNNAVPRFSKSKAATLKKRKAFTHSQLAQLLQEAVARGDIQLAQLIWLAMWTGCRIEELCSLKLTNVFDDHFKVDDAKTEAGEREVPIHSRLSP